MRLIQLNAWGGRFINQINAFLKDQNPDIICLQEVYSSQLDTPLLPYFNCLERIQASVPDFHVFFSGVHEVTILGVKVTYGNAILSRYPLDNNETFFINGAYRAINSLSEMDSNIRNAQRATVRLPHGSFSLINHHAYWEPNSIGSNITVEKMQKIAKIVQDSPRPLILAGDLQVTAESPAMKPLQSSLRDLTMEHNLTTTLSSFSMVTDVACDHICVSDDVNVENFQASDTLVSDHKALILDFKIS